MRKVWGLFLVFVLSLGLVGLAQAASLEFHGEFGVKVQTTNNAGILTNFDDLETWNSNAMMGFLMTDWDTIGGKRAWFASTNRAALGDAHDAGITVDEFNGKDLDDTWASLQFRLWAVASSDDGKIKGVWAMEVGSARFGENDQLDLHNESTNIESRMLYLDFALPWFENVRAKVGLAPYYVNRFLWNETAPGIALYGNTDLGFGNLDYALVWVRARDKWGSNNDKSDNNDADAYAIVLGYDATKMSGLDKAKVLGYFIYLNDQTRSYNYYYNGLSSDNQPWYLGLDLDLASGLWSLNTGFIYEGGDFDLHGNVPAGMDDNMDHDAYLLYAELGYRVNEQIKASFLWWWATGDDDPYDGDVENFNAIDTHTFGSVVLFEDAAFDDGYVVSRHPYLNNLGFQMYRLRVDYQATPRLALAAAVNYMKFDEDAYWVDEAGNVKNDDDIGWELDVYAKYELYKDLTLDVAAGYLWAGDGLDAWADKDGNGYVDSDADDMYRISVGVTYSF
ncbi:hypothetical protein [Thermosulfurimonas dismutans]|uniref:Alginate export domain-containing protein n=1 Tax=Thermosulfurimonas dismutans TaxID=999894 RepID=A0A179D2R1_9BACT|nr:hypothetical protein [Thermosulfurimonas dismutans]OAQ20263.1 hypothetical protein TDIS_1618 [Thermosulfurimonas dismutans]